MKNYCKEIHIYKMNLLSVLVHSGLSFFKQFPLQVGYFYSSSIKQKIENSILALQPDTIYCQLSRTALYAQHLPFRKVIDLQDAFSMNYQRTFETSTGLQKLFYKRESKLMRAFETKMLQWFDEATIIATIDKENIELQPNRIQVVGNGVDFSFYQPLNCEKKYELLFLGNLSYLPNKNAVDFLLEKIMPLLIQQFPNIQLHIAGASTPSEYKQYESDNIHFVGWVDDVRKTYAESIVFVAPLFTGAGLQNKILEAMSMKIPCITTSVVNASLQATDNEDLLIANTAEEFTEKIIYLLQNAHIRYDLSEHAKCFVEKHYSWDHANEKLLALL
jgi:glycosyltransferase involved in cell wall biosynthesis